MKKTQFLITLLLLIFFLSDNLIAEVTTFLKTYRSKSVAQSLGGAAKVLPDGRIIISSGITRSFIIETDNKGNIIRQKVFRNALGFPIFYSSILPVNNDRFFYSGISAEQGTPILFGILDKNFNRIFLKSLSTSNLGTGDWKLSLVGDFGDGYVFFISNSDCGFTSSKNFLFKTDYSGRLIWTTEIKGGCYSSYKAEDSIVLYESNSKSITLLDRAGNIIFSKEIRSTDQNLTLKGILKVSKISNNELLIPIIGSLRSSSSLIGILIAKMDLQGNIKSSKFIYSNTFTSFDTEILNLTTFSDNSLYFLGTTPIGRNNVGLSKQGIFIVKTDTSGNVQWGKLYDFDSLSFLIPTVEVTNENIVLSGSYSPSNIIGSFKLFLMKTDKNGKLFGCDNVKVTEVSLNSMDFTSKVNSRDFLISLNNVSLPVLNDAVLNISEGDYLSENVCEAVASLPQLPFPDISQDFSWAIDAIQWIKNRGITTGYPDGTFRPEWSVKRSEMAAFIIRTLEGEPASGSYSPNPYFSDVPPTHWAFRYVQRLKERGIASGYAGTTLFGPEDAVTREQMAKMLIMALVSQGRTTEPYVDYCSIGVPFTDIDAGTWSCRYIKKLKELGITQGCNPPENTRYCPLDRVTRAQMAVFLYRAFNR